MLGVLRPGYLLLPPPVNILGRQPWSLQPAARATVSHTQPAVPSDVRPTLPAHPSVQQHAYAHTRMGMRWMRHADGAWVSVTSIEAERFL